jgi:hypothetical protein
MRILKISLFFLCFLASCAMLQAKTNTLVIEAESFQCQANWWLTYDTKASGRQILQARGGEGDALTVINVEETGHYQLWTRSRDYATNQPRSRKYLLVIDDQPVAIESGQHGQEGWQWECVGSRELTAGQHILALRDSAKFYGRCDAIMLATDNTLDPNKLSMSQLKRHVVEPVIVALTHEQNAVIPQLKTNAQGNVVSTLSNDRVKITFVQMLDQDNKPVIIRRTSVKRAEQWVDLPVDSTKEAVFTLHNTQARVDLGSFHPAWPGQSPVIQMTVNGKTYTTRGKNQDPFSAGVRSDFVPRSIASQSRDAVDVIYENTAGEQLHAMWFLDDKAADALVTFKLIAKADGFYSIGFSAFKPWETSEIRFNQLSPMVQFVRRHDEPVMTTSSCSPLPMALVESMSPGDATISYALVADPDHLSTQWPGPRNAMLGLSMLNHKAAIQPTVFGPIMGFDNSRFEAGDHVTMSCRVMTVAGDWKAAQQVAMRDIFQVTDYRKPIKASLSQSYLNMVDLMASEQGGWNDKLMGFYNIESPSTVTHASPLGIVEAALLTDSEAFFKDRVMPTIGYTLSRPSSHFAASVPEDMHVYVNEKRITLTVPTQFYGAAYWQGLHDMLGRRNAWLADMIFGNGIVNYSNDYSTIPAWSELLANYRLKPDVQLLDRIVSEADEFLEKEIYARRTDIQQIRHFYNISFYPYWWDLQDLYEVTGKKRYLDAAIEGANFTMAGQWAHPRPMQQSQVIHQGNHFGNDMPNWWLGDKRFRLGYPLKDDSIVEHQVPNWQVSSVGLGFEQPTTLYATGKGDGLGMILMSAWAPNLLRLYGNTGNDLYQSYARNSIIGRFANYPGYYVRGETDLYHAVDYPYTGPDVTSLYYHHVPPHAAFTMDFLVTQANVRSKGAIDFPWSRQQGYVWFTNRVFGQAPGSIFDDHNVTLRLTRKPFTVNTPMADYLLGYSDQATYLVLMNQLDETLHVPVSVDVNDTRLMMGQQALLRDNTGKVISKVTVQEKMTVAVPAKGMVVLQIQNNAKQTLAKASELPVLKRGYVQQEIDGPWKQMHAFRIRSPFGHDGLYLVLLGHPQDGAAAQLTLKLSDGSTKTMTSDAFPHEFIVYPIEMNQDVQLQLQLTDADGNHLQTAPLTLRGGDGMP